MRTKPVSRMVLVLVLLAAIVSSVACAGPGPSSPAAVEKKASTSSAPAEKAAAPAPKAEEKAVAPAAKEAEAKPKASTEPYTINFIATLTGPLAASGQKQRLGAQVFEKYINARGGINGRPINFRILDDQTNPKVSVQLFTDLIAQKVPVIMGPGSSGATFAVLPLVQDNGPVVYATNPAGTPPPGGYLFSGMPANATMVEGMLAYLRNKGWTKLGMLQTTDASGSDFAEAVKKMMELPENRSLELVVHETAEPGATSMAAQAAKIKASNAQAIIFALVGAPFSTASKGLLQGGINLPVITNVANQNYVLLQGNKDVLPKELLFAGLAPDVPDIVPAGPTRDAITQFRKLLMDSGEMPEVSHTPPWVAASVIVEAMKKTGTDTTPAKLRDTIESMKGYQGVLGVQNFSRDDRRGIGLDSIFVQRWDADKGTWIPVSGPGGSLLKN